MLVSLSCFHVISTTHDCYDRISLPIHPRWALVRPRAASRGQDARCLQLRQHCGLDQMVNSEHHWEAVRLECAPRISLKPLRSESEA